MTDPPLRDKALDEKKVIDLINKMIEIWPNNIKIRPGKS
jgi:hypothetical protein